MEEVYVAMVGGQWIRINREEMPCYLHTRCLKRPDQDNDSKSGLDRFRKRLEKARKRKGSPLKHEWNPEANMFWRWVEIEGEMKWIKKDWSQEPPRKLWGFSDSDDSDDDYLEMKQTAKSAANRTEHNAVRNLAPEQASSQSRDAATPEIPQKADVPRKQVSLGGDTFFEHETYPEDREWKVEFREDILLDPEEAEDRAPYHRFSGLATIESAKETRLRRKLLIPASQGHDCQSCMDREGSFDDQAERRVSFGSTTITEIPEEFVTIVDEEKARESFATAIEDREESEDEIEVFDKPEKRDHDSERNEQPVDGGVLAPTAGEPKDTKPLRQTTIRFAPVTVVKESPANQLPALKYFPDFCTASKPIFRPDRQRQQITQ